MPKFTYRTQGTCSSMIQFEVEGDIVTHVEFIHGCTGNLQALAQLSKGRTVEELITLLRGIECRNGTSCPDQFARALEALRLTEKSHA